jgi:DNA-3-methyladenine glycosylase II
MGRARGDTRTAGRRGLGPRTRRLTLSTAAPFRLDLTVAVLQRLPGTPVDVWHDGAYWRAFDGPEGPVVWRVTQPGAAPLLRVDLEGVSGPLGPWRARLRRMLGLDVDLAPFLAVARRIPALAPVLPFARGLRPPRFESLHEAFAAVILFQQVSLASAVAILRRLVAALSPERQAGGGAVLRPFPPAARLADAPDALLRAAGLSGAKARSLRAAAGLVASGALRDEELARLPSPLLVETLREVPGVGPWTASLLALRYFGRLDLFPPGDVAAAKALGEVGDPRLVEALGPWRGMLYYLLFVRRMTRTGAPPWILARAPLARPRRAR